VKGRIENRWAVPEIDLVEMEETVKDAILVGSFDDLALLRLVEVTTASIQEDRPLFTTILAEPAFYRKYFVRWVREALEEKHALLKAQSKDPLRT